LDNNTLKYKLSYCNFCRNKSFDNQRGTLCGLTNEKPEFIKSCHDYYENEQLIDYITTTLRGLIKKRYSELSFMKAYQNPHSVFREISSPTNNFKSKKETWSIKRTNSKVFGYIFIVFSLFLFISLLRENITWNNVSIIILTTSISLLGFGLYEIFNKKIKFSVNPYGMFFKDEFIYFNDIIFVGSTYLKNAGDKKLIRNTVLIGTKSCYLFEFHTDETNITPEEIAEIVERNIT